MTQKYAVIIGAGPAGLTAAYELILRTDIKPIIFEMTGDIGGISKTVNFKGNRIDIGGHRFFSKSDRVMNWWNNILPLQGRPSIDDILLNRKMPLSDLENAPDPEKSDHVMLFRNRISRIFFNKRFFDYPISLKVQTIRNLGLKRMFKIGISYLQSRLYPIAHENSLEDFFINRFGKELYRTFFKDYTEKVWGIACNQIKPEWGAQRVKGLSITSAVMHAIKTKLSKDESIYQKNVETTLIEQFMYPKYGPGQMWETVCEQIQQKGAQVFLNHEVVGLNLETEKITNVTIKNSKTGEIFSQQADYVFSTMPVKDLIHSLGNPVPDKVQKIASGLKYRDFITVGLLLKKMKVKNKTAIKTINNIIPDNWIYIQESGVKLGRVQVFNNWSPYMVKNQDYIWLGLEYFCNMGDMLWNMADKELIALAGEELTEIEFIESPTDVLDGVVIRMPKTYPAYFGTYDSFHMIREYVDRIENLFLVGRNGMHRYNNMDHSMLTAMTAVDNIINNVFDKDNIWQVNTEETYHEEVDN